MKNLFLTSILSLLSVSLLGQSLNKSIVEVFTSVNTADSIVIYSVVGPQLNDNPFLLDEFYMDEFTYTKVASYDSQFAKHKFEDAGIFVVFCLLDGEPAHERTLFVIDDSYVEYIANLKGSQEINNTIYSTIFEYVGLDEIKVVSVH
jgi:hypothetical protein